MSLDSLKKGVSKINTKILKYLKVLKIFATGVCAQRKLVKFVASTASYITPMEQSSKMKISIFAPSYNLPSTFL